MEFIKDLVSICIPTYNGAKYIKEAIQSALLQDYKNIEIIVNDDCSKDDTLEVVKSLNIENIQIFKNEKNLGLVGNWNAAIKHAKGEFIKLLHQDDVLCEGAISKQVKMLKENRSAHICVGNTYIINKNSEVIMKRNYLKKDKVFKNNSFAKLTFLGRNFYGEPSNLLFYNKDFYELNGYNDFFKYVPDWDFNLRLEYLGKELCYVGDYIMKYRISDTSETFNLYSKKKKLINDDIKKLLEEHISLGQIKFSYFRRIWFICIMKLLAFARKIILIIKK